ncbi:MAG: glycosyltransferase [Pedobacter sp.]|nr:MAG: glycosyltransferase [Pedobacter sp.]
MKIAIITTMNSSVWGGSEELWYKTALMAKANNHEVLACVQERTEDITQIRQLKKSGIHLIKLPKITFYKGLLIRLYNKFFKLNYYQKFDHKLIEVKRFDPDVICVSQGGTFDISPNKILYDFLIETSKSIIIICHHNREYGGNFSNEQAKFEANLFDKAKKIVFVAERNLETAQRQLAKKIHNSVIVSSPINITNYKFQPWKISHKLIMASVGRLETETKGQDILLQALSKDIWRDRAFELNIYGNGYDEGYLKRLIKYFNLENKVFLRGHVNEVSNIWKSNHALVLSSSSEGTPLCLVEAMLSGRTAVATDVGGVDKYIIHNDTGFLTPFGSVDQMNEALNTLWLNRNNLQDMGKRAFTHAMKITDLNPEETLLNIILNQDALIA